MQQFLPLITIPIALLFGSLAFWDYQRTQKLIAHGKRTTGRYIGVERDIERGEDAISMTEYSMIEFTTDTNRIIQFQGRTGSLGRGRLVGQSVEIFYDVQEPENARINSFIELWMFAMIFGSIGIAVLLATPLLWILSN